MAVRVLISVTLFLLALITGRNVLGQIPSSSTSCTSSIASLSPCIGFLTGGYSTAAPGCCSAVATASIGSAGSCLCQFLSTNNPFGFSFNQTRALLLSGLCNVNAPCTTAGSPSASPAGGRLPFTPPVALPPGSNSIIGALIPSAGSSGTGNGDSTSNVGSRTVSTFTTSWIGLVGGLLLAYIYM